MPRYLQSQTRNCPPKRGNFTRSQRGIKEKFREGLIRLGQYLSRIEAIFQEHGLPAELALLPYVESSFDYDAYSKRGAAGIWQFIRGTGRRFLKLNLYVDERLDPLKSSEAARCSRGCLRPSHHGDQLSDLLQESKSGGQDTRPLGGF
jgi:hypothetical protein